jgi:hypothetical protein
MNLSQRKKKQWHLHQLEGLAHHGAAWLFQA